MFSDTIPTLVLGLIALICLVIVAVSMPRIIRDHREWKRRRQLTPMQRAMEDMTAAFDKLVIAFANAFAPAISNLAVVMNDLAEALDPPKEKLTQSHSAL